MKRLAIILVITGILSSGSIHAADHSVLSNSFTLDTRDAPPPNIRPPTGDALPMNELEHSALSDGFVLDTRDVSPPDIRPPTGDAIPMDELEHSALSDGFVLDTRDSSPPDDDGSEHSALSDGFILDTRDTSVPTGTEHSDLSNGFTLDTRDLPADVDGSGVVDTADLVSVALDFGGPPSEGSNTDLNGDGTVDIMDLIIVAVHLGETTVSSAPATLNVPNLDVGTLEQWLKDAKAVDDGSEKFRQGIAVLERLLNAAIPQQTAVFANYPNPFNPDTWIPYQLRESSRVAITIYDISGKAVRHLDLGQKPVGKYLTKTRAAHWDGRNEVGESVASGIYFALLEAGEYKHTSRLVLIK
ncbi:FlgD immunoglobulin-like domain containing protein [Candidatus Poribacteria bacterium]